MSFSASLLQLSIIMSLIIFLFIYYMNNKKLLIKSREYSKRINEIENEMEIREYSITKEKTQFQFQIANEVRSPLVPLQFLIAKAEELSEESRKLLRQSIHRLQDISQLIIHNNQEKNEDFSLIGHTHEKHKVQLLSTLIQDIVSEKRILYRELLGVEIFAELGLSSYGLFAKIPLLEFKKVLSQLIDNSVDTISNNGSVKIRLSSSADNIFMFITNSGTYKATKAIPKIILSESNRLKTTNKGSALCHAKTVVESMGGKFEFRVQFGTGAAVKIILPKVSIPNWFASSLKIKPNSYVVIIDEDAYIHSLWQESFKNILSTDFNIQLIHFSQLKEVIAWSESAEYKKMEHKYFLSEFNFNDCSMSGIDFISMMPFTNNSFIVTNKYTEKNIIAICQKANIKIIPKDNLFFIPLEVLKPKDKPNAILINDDSLIKMVWHLTAIKQNKKIVIYKNLEKFLDNLEMYDHGTSLFIDIDYLNKNSGNKKVLQIYNLGFKQIYLITGQNPSLFIPAKWVNAIVTNEPPWLLKC
ncbi:ATP-binding protein [Fluviispira multicolorata]|uniref:Histidine kinase domain-containing protein n=1 Tax=Fluviispira multicolorata TaxID=2654512 RepID=A0A833JH93_9BACT|nr:ATP-binding protein [Fluviispira multicolorata]KAB8033272.1 hypothetical protein GCL57_00830 [Fluviispira multicolorata]